MSNINYTFSSSSLAISGYSPLIVTFKPNSIPLSGAQFLSKLVYELPNKTVTRNNTFVSNSEAATDAYKNIDCRADFPYIFANEDATITTPTVRVVSISAFIGPDNYPPSVYTLSATLLLPYFTRNPLASASPYAFGEIHLLKCRAYGSTNSQVFLLESKDPNYLIVNHDG